MRFAIISLIILMGCTPPMSDYSPLYIEGINESNKVCQSKVIRKEISTTMEDAECKRDVALAHAKRKNLPDQDIMETYYSELIRMAQELDEKKISRKQFDELHSLAIADYTAKLDNQQKQRNVSAAHNARVGSAFGQSLQNWGNNMQQRSLQNRPVTCFGNPTGGGYGYVNCY